MEYLDSFKGTFLMAIPYNRLTKGGIDMLQTTTNVLQGKTIVTYHGIVSGEAIMGANIVRDLFATVTDIVGGRSAAYEDKLSEGRQIAIDEMTQRAKAMG